MLYQRVTGDFYTINSEGKFTLPSSFFGLVICVICVVIWSRIEKFFKTVRRSKVTPVVRQLPYGSFTGAFSAFQIRTFCLECVWKKW